MKHLLLSVFICAAFFACSCGTASYDHRNPLPDHSELEKNIDALVGRYLDLDIFSGVVLVAEDGRPVYRKAFGLADRGRGIPNTINTKFDIGSMNKTFTKVVLLQLLEAGELQLADPLGKYLPEFDGEPFTGVTIDGLMHHTAGFGDYHMSPDYFELPDDQKNIAALVQRIRSQGLTYEPDTDRMYSNSGYILLGAVIEAVTGRSYFENVRERIVEPLGLQDTYVSNVQSIDNRAFGYFKTVKGELQDNREFSDVPNPDGGFYSTADDILKFYCEYHYGHQLLKEETKMQDEFYRMIQEHRTTGRAIPFAGGFPGSNTVDYEILRDRITVIVLANMDEPVAEKLGAGILAVIRGETPETPSLPAGQRVYRAFMEYGAEYVMENFGTLTVNFHPTDPKDLIINMVGYELLFDGQAEEAIALFGVNAKLFPDVPNVWDSLAEAYLHTGDEENALKYYRKALSLDPQFPSALEAVQRIENGN